MRLYLAGPMRGIPEWNFSAFEEARTRLRAMGHTVFCPAANALAMGFSQVDDLEIDRSRANHVMQMDMACIYAADAIAILPGWEQSLGCTVEVAMAQFLGMPIYDTFLNRMINPAFSPWGILRCSKHKEPT